MTKETIERIITNNRRPFAIHQIWTEVSVLQMRNERLIRAANAAIDAIRDESPAKATKAEIILTDVLQSIT